MSAYADSHDAARAAPCGLHAPHAHRRRHRTAVALRLMARAPDAAAALDWEALESAPDWLGLPESDLATFECRVGAVLCSPTLRLWIDGPRIAAVRAAVGDTFYQALLAQPRSPSTPIDLAARARIDVAGQVGTLLQVTGASVLLAAMPHGPLRQAASVALAPAAASAMAIELARSLVARAHALAMNAASSAAGGAA